MQFKELEEKGRIQKIKVNFKQIHNFLFRSRKDLQTSKANLAIDREWSYAISYHAVLRAGRALMMSFGYRPRGRDQHTTVVRFASIVFGDKFKGLVRNFDRMRRKRHDFIYEPDRPISRQEAEQSIKDAEALVKQIWLVVNEKDPRKGKIT
ncbi:MAG: HEPN domain-containing protein [Candidatus Aminicenantes bacterium]|nr:HEPN domain-containing protein [Candidatus Aminicenantes bacterium]